MGEPDERQTAGTETGRNGGRPGEGGLRIVRRLLRTALGTAVGAYAVVCVVVFSLQAKFIYFPSREYWTTPDEIGLAYEEVELVTEDGVTLAAWDVPQEGATATVLFAHGNAGNIADRVGSIKAFHDLGYSVFIFDYRGYGGSRGSPNERGTYRDADAAWRFLTETRGLAPERIVLFGRSLGGAVAIELATRQSPGALVVESTFTSLVDVGKIHYRFLPVRLLCVHRYESVDRVARVTCPKLFIHSVDDSLVPIENGRRLFEAAAPPKAFMETPGGHNSGGFEYSPEYTLRLQEWLSGALIDSAAVP
jgi:fermentation-respiration switch protein FrsA (DUF1100 family)